MSVMSDNIQSALTAAEVAVRAKRSERTVWRWMRDADFPKPIDVPFGGRVLFNAAEVDAYLRRREAAA
jgi:predicted DNA-binding transcriptional regulator AlpA